MVRCERSNRLVSQLGALRDGCTYKSACVGPAPPPRKGGMTKVRGLRRWAFADTHASRLHAFSFFLFFQLYLTLYIYFSFSPRSFLAPLVLGSTSLHSLKFFFNLKIVKGTHVCISLIGPMWEPFVEEGSNLNYWYRDCQFSTSSRGTTTDKRYECVYKKKNVWVGTGQYSNAWRALPPIKPNSNQAHTCYS